VSCASVEAREAGWRGGVCCERITGEAQDDWDARLDYDLATQGPTLHSVTATSE
jgi:hypothetical protein